MRGTGCAFRSYGAQMRGLWHMFVMLACFELLTQPDGSHRRRCCVRRIIWTQTLAFMAWNGCRPLQGCCGSNVRRFHRQDRRKSTLECRRGEKAFFRRPAKNEREVEIGLVLPLASFFGLTSGDRIRPPWAAPPLFNPAVSDAVTTRCDAHAGTSEFCGFQHTDGRSAIPNLAFPTPNLDRRGFSRASSSTQLGDATFPCFTKTDWTYSHGFNDAHASFVVTWPAAWPGDPASGSRR
jgi:hypothetical protein